MAVTVTDTRTVIDEADTTTGWTGASGTSTSVFAEATASVIQTLNIATGQVYFGTTARNVSNTLIYIWSNNFALQSEWDAAQPPNAMHLGDGTNRISFKMAGANRKVFAHLDAGTGVPVDWDCLVLDGSQASAMNTAGYTTVRAGSFAGLNLSAITQFGSDFTTLSKGLGGGINVAVDIIRIGNDGLVITGGTTGSRGKFIEIVDLDKSTANLRAHGIIREYTTGLYGLQGPLTFGDGTGTSTSWFQDSNSTLVFENRNISNDKYYLRVRGNATGETHFILTNSAVSTAGPFVTIDFAGTNINELTVSNNTFRGLGNAVSFANDTAGGSHTVTNNVFDTCGQIDPGKVNFSNNTISNTTDANGGLLIDADGTTNISDISFVSDGTGHAIYITATGTYSFTNFTYSGYGANDTTDAVVYNNSGGAVTINVSGGNVPTVRNGTGASTTVVASVDLTLTILDVATNPIQNAQVAIYRTSDNAELMNQLSNASGIATTTYGGTTPTNIYIRVRKSSTGTRYLPVQTVGTIGSGGFGATITLVEDLTATI